MPTAFSFAVVPASASGGMNVIYRSLNRDVFMENLPSGQGPKLEFSKETWAKKSEGRVSGAVRSRRPSLVERHALAERDEPSSSRLGIRDSLCPRDLDQRGYNRGVDKKNCFEQS